MRNYCEKGKQKKKKKKKSRNEINPLFLLKPLRSVNNQGQKSHFLGQTKSHHIGVDR
jgi:hypothetical protein